MYVHAMENEPDPASAPPTMQLVGKVKLSSEGQRIPVSATLLMVPGRTITFKCSARPNALSVQQREMLTGSDVSWEVSGTMTDGDKQRPLQCRKLQCIQTGVGFSEREGHWWHGVFAPVERLVLGSQRASRQCVRAASFALMTYVGPGVMIEVDGWEYSIQIPPPKRQRLLKEHARVWEAPIETAKLVVTPPKPTPPEELCKRVDPFLLALSLSQGADISYNRCEVTAPKGASAEIWALFKVFSPVIGRSVGFLDLQEFLPTALASCKSLPEDEQKRLRLAIRYHLEAKRQRTLQPAFVSEAIAWEMMAASEGPLGEPETKLLKRLKTAYREWRKGSPDHAAADKCGAYGKRLEGCLWQPLHEGITRVIGEVGLDWLLQEERRDTTGLPDPLVEISRYRNSIVHNGRLPDRGEGGKEHHETLKGLLTIGDLIFVEKLCPGASENFFSA